MTGARARRGRVWVTVAVVIAACSGDKAGSHSGLAGMGVSGAGATNPGAANAGASGSQPGGFGNAASNTPRADASMPILGTPDCVGKTQQGEEVEVDMYIMLDRSGSMNELTGSGSTKWDAIRSALTSFVQAPESSGLGVGLQYFPLGAPGIPDSCMVDGDCGNAGGACSNKACVPPRFSTNFAFTPCFTDSDCPFQSPGCQAFGICSGDSTLACFNLGPTGCQAQGACTAPAGECANYDSCVTGDYATPAVPIDLLPANASPLTASLMAEKPIGLTPTPAALAGAINRASQHAMQNPSHRVIAVLATDGLPTDCLPANTTTENQAVMATANIAAQGLALQSSIETYVIGVFSPDDPNAMASLDQLAAAGGTTKAFIVDQSKDVGQQLLDALSTIRSGALSCDLQLPAAPNGKTLDYGFVNVQFTEAGTMHNLFNVDGMAQCGQTDLAWYYDADPKQGQTPTKISVCPRTCDTLKAAKNASIEIRLGCPSTPPI